MGFKERQADAEFEVVEEDNTESANIKTDLTKASPSQKEGE